MSPGILGTLVLCWLGGEWLQIVQSIPVWIADFHGPSLFYWRTWNITFSSNLGSYCWQSIDKRAIPSKKVPFSLQQWALGEPVTVYQCVIGLEMTAHLHVLTKPKHTRRRSHRFSSGAAYWGPLLYCMLSCAFQHLGQHQKELNFHRRSSGAQGHIPDSLYYLHACY